MIVMDVKLDNIYAFKNFHANFSYPKKIVNTNIENEFLSEFPKFRFKKVNIIMGSNATGKTTFGKALIAIFNYIDRDNPIELKKSHTTDDDGHVSIDFVTHDIRNEVRLFRVKIKICKNDNDQADDVVFAAMNSVLIKKSYNYEKCAEKLDSMNYEFTKDTITLFDDIYSLGWYFSDINTKSIDVRNQNNDNKFIKILNIVMKSFDNSIKNVHFAEEKLNDYIVVTFKNNQSIIVQDGKVLGNRGRLSSGTLSALQISELIFNIMYRKNGFYYCDEKFCYVQSDLEKAVLSVMIEVLGSDQQLFFTTHNTDVLDLDLPKHTYQFMKKDLRNLDEPIKLISASDYLKKQDSSLRSAVENDLFGVAPDDSNIYQILDLLSQKR